MRTVASIGASALLLAATPLTWAGVAAVVLFCLLVFDAQRRVRNVLGQLDDFNDRLDSQRESIEELKAIVTGDDQD